MAAVTPVKNKTNVWTWLRQIRPRMLLAIPFIYGMTVVLLLLDLTISLYQAVCFPLYGIAKVHRSEYMSIDRSLLPYLNIIEKVNCVYCSYANGIFAYSREIGARTPRGTRHSDAGPPRRSCRRRGTTCPIRRAR